MNANRNMRELRTKARRVNTALEQLEAANAVLQPLIEAPLAPKIPDWLPEVVNQKIWNMRNKFETELTRLDQLLEKAANAANRSNGPAMYPELTDEELSVLENEIEYLIKDAKLLQSDDCPPFTQVEFTNAFEGGNADVVHLLLHDPTIDPSANNNDAIKVASRVGHTNVVKVLLADPRVDPSADSNEAIYGASRNGNIEIVKLLLADHRVDSTADNNWLLYWASIHGYLGVVQLLLKRRDVVAKGLYQHLIPQGKTEEIRKLLREAFNVVGGRRTTRQQRTTRRATRQRRTTRRHQK